MRGLFLFLGCLLPSAILSAQAVLIDMQFIPPTFFVGDLVELHLEFSANSELKIQAPEILPKADWVDIRNVRVLPGDGTVSVLIDFTPFATGIRTLPSLNLGDIQLQDIKIPTHSMLKNSHDGVRRVRGQLLLPGTRLGLALILALTGMAPFLIYALLKLVLRWARHIKAMFSIRRPVRRLHRLLKRLRADIGSESASYWFSALTGELRAYLSTRMDYNCRSATTAEISAMMDLSAENAPQNRILEVLRNGDMVKFARHRADASSLKRTLKIVESAVTEWEKAIARL